MTSWGLEVAQAGQQISKSEMYFTSHENTKIGIQ